jgi:hypothetical protein
MYQAFGPDPDRGWLMDGAFRYGFYGDDSTWRQMISEAGGDPATLDAFREKYDNYILQDFRWTLHNWAVMEKQPGPFRDWWRDFGGYTGRTESISGYIDRLGLGACADRDRALRRIFDEMAGQVLGILDGPPPRLNIKAGMAQAVDNYLVGQSRIFYQYGFLPQTAYYRDRMRAALERDRRPDIQKLRALYDKYLGVLLENRLINPDDERLYQQVYPIFDFTLVRYDERPDLDPLAHLGW